VAISSAAISGAARAANFGVESPNIDSRRGHEDPMIRFLRLLAVAVLIADGALIAVAPGEAAERDATYSSN
jgi:hypothetical protein